MGLTLHQLPTILEGDLVHFVFRGEVDDLALGSDFFPAEKPMHRVDG